MQQSTMEGNHDARTAEIGTLFPFAFLVVARRMCTATTSRKPKRMANWKSHWSIFESSWRYVCLHRMHAWLGVSWVMNCDLCRWLVCLVCRLSSMCRHTSCLSSIACFIMYEPFHPTWGCTDAHSHAACVLCVVGLCVGHVHLQFDKDKSGKVSIKELFAGLGQVLGGSVDERSEFYFTLCTPPARFTAVATAIAERISLCVFYRRH